MTNPANTSPSRLIIFERSTVRFVFVSCEVSVVFTRQHPRVSTFNWLDGGGQFYHIFQHNWNRLSISLLDSFLSQFTMYFNWYRAQFIAGNIYFLKLLAILSGLAWISIWGSLSHIYKMSLKIPYWLYILW